MSGSNLYPTDSIVRGKSETQTRSTKTIQKVARYDHKNDRVNKLEKRPGLIRTEKSKTLRDKNSLALKGHPSAHKSKTRHAAQQQQDDDRSEKVKARKKEHDRMAAVKQSDQSTDLESVTASHSVTEENSARKGLLWNKDRSRPDKRESRFHREIDH